MENLKLVIESSTAPTSLIALLRRHTGFSIGQIKSALLAGTPVLDVSPHHNEYDDFMESTEALICQLEKEHCDFRLIVDGEEESSQFARNVFKQWGEIKEHIESEDDRRFDRGGDNG